MREILKARLLIPISGLDSMSSFCLIISHLSFIGMSSNFYGILVIVIIVDDTL